MSVVAEQILMRAYLQSADRAPLTPTYERLLSAARQHGLVGATVLRGILGLGAHGMTGRSTWSLVQHLPIIVEIVDTPDAIVGFLSGPAAPLLREGLVTLERAHVMAYRHGPRQESARLQLGERIEPLSTIPNLEGSIPMATQENGVMLRVFIGESDKFERQPLYEAIVQKAHALGLAGATVLRGVEGFGAHSVVHKAQLLEASTGLPLVVEIVDVQEKIERMLPYLETAVSQGMITMEYVTILQFRHDAAAASQPAP